MADWMREPPPPLGSEKRGSVGNVAACESLTVIETPLCSSVVKYCTVQYVCLLVLLLWKVLTEDFIVHTVQITPVRNCSALWKMPFSSRHSMA